MAFDTTLADRIRIYLTEFSNKKVEEKKMFSGLAFTVNGKMCINVSGDKLMCRFDPERQEEVFSKKGVEPMVMKGKELKGYCYVQPIGFKAKKDFEYWMNLCLDFNERAKAFRKKSRVTDKRNLPALYGLLKSNYEPEIPCNLFVSLRVHIFSRMDASLVDETECIETTENLRLAWTEIPATGHNPQYLLQRADRTIYPGRITLRRI